jgi:hypothetical protein
VRNRVRTVAPPAAGGLSGESDRVSGSGLRTLAATGATLGAVLVVGFAVQAVALGRPGPKPRLVVRVVAELANYHDSRATMTVAGSRLNAVCSQSWEHRQRAVSVGLGDGQKLIESGNTLLPGGQLAADEFALAGCPRPPTRWLADQINRGAPLEVNATRLFGTPVYRVRFPTARPRLVLYVRRRGALPVALRIVGGGIRGISELSYGRSSGAGSPGLREGARAMSAW